MSPPLPHKTDESVLKAPPRGFYKRTAQRFSLIIKNITLEPYVFLLHLATGLVGVSVSQMQIYKACIIDMKYDRDICINLLEHKEENDKVQDLVSYQLY